MAKKKKAEEKQAETQAKAEDVDDGVTVESEQTQAGPVEIPSDVLQSVAKAVQDKVTADRQYRGIGQPSKVDKALIVASQELQKLLKN